MLRELHQAVLEGLRTTFPGVLVHEHGGEVDVDTIRRLALGKVNMLVTLASSEVAESLPSEVRSRVHLGVFVIAGAVDVEPDATPSRTPTGIAAKYVERLQALLVLQTWDLEGVEPIESKTIVANNLGVGIKSNRESLETNRLGLWVVWWEQVVGFGEPLELGKATLPDVEFVEGVIEDVVDQGQIGVLEDLQES